MPRGRCALWATYRLGCRRLKGKDRVDLILI
jgi:hypothetical protein